jgi:predicted RNase H-like HicB family nuclease
MRYTFTAVYVQARDGDVLAYIEELSGAHAQVKTIAGWRERLGLEEVDA